MITSERHRNECVPRDNLYPIVRRSTSTVFFVLLIVPHPTPLSVGPVPTRSETALYKSQDCKHPLRSSSHPYRP